MSENNILERRFPGRRSTLKREILEQALACFNEFGFEATTIESIKARCDTSVGAIYHHFGKKEGILSALFFTAQDDQREHLERYLDNATTLQEAVCAIVTSYVDWVVAHPEWARFLFQARSSVASGPYRQELKDRNIDALQKLKEKFVNFDIRNMGVVEPFELLLSLIIGPSENYCKAWLSRRVRTSPDEYREKLAESAWRSIL